MPDSRPLIYSIAGFFAGIFFFFRGLKAMTQKKLIESIPTSKVRSIAMGLCEVCGEAVPIKGKTLKSPFSNKDCVYYKYTIEEYRKSGKSSRWVLIGSGEEGTTFFLKDETGNVLVDAKGAVIEIPMDFEFNSSLGKDPNKFVQDFITKKSIGFEGIFGWNKTMRFREYFIAPRDTLYVMGTAGDNPFVREGSARNGSADIMIQKGAGSSFYYISDSPEKDVLKKFKWKVISGVYGGGALCVCCLAIILMYLNLF